MAKRVIFYIPATVAAALFTTGIEIGTMKWALAGSDCIEQPNRQAAPGGHWFYRTDSVNNRKCWRLVEPVSSMPGPEAPKAEPSEPSTRAALQQETLPHAKFLPAPPVNRTELEPIEE
jgi:hypothetical protein